MPDSSNDATASQSPPNHHPLDDGDWPLPAPRAWAPVIQPSDRVDAIKARTATAWAVPQTKRTVAPTDQQLGVF